MKYKFILLLGFWIPFIGFAQNLESDSLQNNSNSVIVTGDADYSLSLSYLGNNMFHPGLHAELEKSWLVKHKHETRTKKKWGEYTLTKSKELLPTAGLGFYVHPRTHTAVFADVGLKFRKTRSNSYRDVMGRWYLSGGVGVYRTFLPETYEIKGDDIKKVPLAGRTFLYPYLKFGREKSWRKNPNHAMFASFTFMFLQNYNNTTVPIANYQIGYRFKITKPRKNHAKSH